MTTRLFYLWALGTALLVPLAMLTNGPALQGAGMGLVAAAVGAVFLYARKDKPDAMRRALIAVVVVAGLLWFGTLR